MARKFTRKRNDATPQRDITTIWPQDTLDDIDDDTFARAIAEGRMADRQLVDA